MVVHRCISLLILAGLFFLGDASSDLLVCSRDADANVNGLQDTPRRNFAFEKVSSDLGAYDLVSTTCPSGEDFCPAPDVELLSNDFNLFIENARDSDYLSSNPNSIINYISSIVFFPAVGITFAVLTVVGGILACCVKIICCRTPKEGGYSRGSVLCTYCLLVTFILSMIILIGLTQKRGNAGTTEALLNIVSAPDAAASLAKGLSTPAVNLAANLAGTAATGLFDRTVDVLDQALDFERMHASADCGREIVLVVNVDALNFFVDTIEEIQSAVLTIIPELALTVAATVNEETSGLEGSINSVIDLFNSTSQSLAVINVSALAKEIDDLEESLVTFGTELNQTLEMAMQVVDVADKADTVSNEIEILLLNVYNNDTAALSAAIADLDDAASGLPDSSTLQTALTDLNTSLANVDNELEQLLSSLQGYQAVLNELPDPAAATAGLNLVIANISSIDLSAVEDDLLNITNTVLELPVVDDVTAKVDEIINTTELLECLLNSTDGLIDRINSTLFVVPDDIAAVEADLQALNQTYEDGLLEIRQLRDEMITLTNQTALDDILQDVAAEFEVVFNATRDQLEVLNSTVSSVETQLTSFDSSTLNATLNAVIVQINSARASVAAAYLQQSQLDAVGNINIGDITTLLSDISAFVPPPVAPTYGCVIGGLTCYDSAEPACASFADIPDSCDVYTPCASGVCSYPWEVLVSVKNGLETFSNSTQESGLSTVISDASSVQSSIDIDLSTVETDVSSFTTYQTDLDTFLNDAVLARDNALDVIFSLEQYLELNATDFTDVNTTFTQAKQEIVQINATLVGYVNTFESALDLEDSVFTFLTQDFDDLIANLSTATLLDLANGPGGMESLFEYLLNQADITLSNDMFKSDLFNDFGIGVTNVSEFISNSDRDSLLEQARIVDILRDSSGELTNKGSIHYFLSVFVEANLVNVTLLENPQGQGIPTPLGFIDGTEFVDYPENTVCATDECIENLVEYVDSENVDSIASVFGIALPADVPVSRQQVTALPFLAPVIIILIAMAVFVWPCLCGNCLSCCTICCAPWLFLTFGGFVFPLLVLLGDSCAGVESIGSNVIGTLNPVICDDYLKGVVTPEGYCSVEIDEVINVTENVSLVLNETIDIDAAKLFLSLFRGCDARSSANVETGVAEPLEALFNALSDKSGPLVKDLLDQFLFADDAFPVTIQDPLLQAINATGDDLVSSLEELLDDLNDALGCDSISSAYLGLKDIMCCDIMTVFYYNVWTWYVMAWVLLCCGCPAGCCAPSRLRNVKESRQVVLSAVYEGQERFAGTRLGQAVTPVAASVGSKMRFRRNKNATEDAPLALAVSDDEVDMGKSAFASAEEPEKFDFSNAEEADKIL